MSFSSSAGVGKLAEACAAGERPERFFEDGALPSFVDFFWGSELGAAIKTQRRVRGRTGWMAVTGELELFNFMV